MRPTFVTIRSPPPPPYVPPPPLPAPAVVRVWTGSVVVDNPSPSDAPPSYGADFVSRMTVEPEVRDARSGEVVGEFLRLEVADGRLYATCTLTRAYASVRMWMSGRGARGYRLSASDIPASSEEERPHMVARGQDH